MWKTLGRANVLSGAGIKKLVLLTTNLPKPGSVGDTALRCAKATFFDAVEMMSPQGRARLRRYAEGEDLQTPLPGFWSPYDVYGNKLKRGGVAGADLSVPLDLTGDPLGSLHGLAVSGMEHRLKVYLPSQTKDGKPITAAKRSQVAARVKSILSGLAGGCTSQDGKGSWVDPFTGVVDEDVELIETYSANQVPDTALREIVDLDPHRPRPAGRRRGYRPANVALLSLMPGIRTEITEIVTGLATLAYPTLDDALAARPAQMLNVDPAHWVRLAAAVEDPAYKDDFQNSWDNGTAFLQAAEGLRRRVPLAVEWKGPHHPPGYDFLPADLRIDHVFLVSCKYLSKVLANLSPSHLFERALAIRGSRSEVDWFMLVAGDAYRRFYERVRATISPLVALPADIEALTPTHRSRLKELCSRTWPGGLTADYDVFSAEVSRQSAVAWNAAVPTLGDRELLLWRILRFNPAPYFILGSAASSHLRLRVAAPWDWRQQFALLNFTISAQEASQPRVRWTAEVRDRATEATTLVEGHVEMRWSHGRFCGFPEAKLYLDTAHEAAPGYFPLT